MFGRASILLLDAREPTRAKLLHSAATSGAAIRMVSSSVGDDMEKGWRKRVIVGEAAKLSLNGLALLSFRG